MNWKIVTVQRKETHIQGPISWAKYPKYPNWLLNLALRLENVTLEIVRLEGFPGGAMV